MNIAIVLFVLVGVVYCRRPDYPCDKICSRYGYSPICSKNNNDYSNDCFLDCNWDYKECDGPCPCNRPPIIVYQPQSYEIPSGYYCGCGNEYDPVCGSDGETYDNKCKAECENSVAVISDGPCPYYIS